MSAFRYDGKRVVVTGAASGMGAATVELLAAAGAEIHALDVAPITAPVAKAYEADLSDPAAIADVVDAIGTPVDRLFNVAGVPQTLPPLTVMQVNFLGLRDLTERMLPLIPEGGAVASVASLAGMGWQQHLAIIDEVLATPDFAAGSAWCEGHLGEQGDPYFFSKECLIVYTLRRAHDTVRHGVRMNSISPGPVESPMMSAFREALDSRTIDWTGEQACGRLGRPDEMAGPLLFLNSDEASYVNGTNLLVDGGFTAAMTMGQVDFDAMTS